MKKIIKLTESDLSNIVKRVIKEDETEFLKLRRRGGYPIITSLDLVNDILASISMEMSEEYGLPEFDPWVGGPTPDYLQPYLDEIKELVNNIDRGPLWDGVSDAVSKDGDVQDLINHIILRYNKDK
jgi:hypothetical protein